MTATLHRTTCNRDCPDACSIVATVEDGRITKLAGDPEHPVTDGFLCYRTNHFLDRQYAPDRLTSPLVRDGDTFRAIPWDAALDLAAERLTTIRRESGAEAIFHYRSGGSLGLMLGVVDRFFDHFGPTTIKRGDICSGAGDAAQAADFGLEDSNDLFDLLNAKNIVLWGKNVYVSSPHTIPVLRQARANGTHLTLIDPVHHRTASMCDTVLQPRPASDFALAMAVAQILFREGWVDSNASTYCDHLDAFRALAFTRSVQAWCDDCEVTPAGALELARRFGPGKPTAILVGWGMGRRHNGAAIVRALDALGAISGNLGISGGGVSFYFKRRAPFDTSWQNRPDSAPRTVCEPMFGRDVLAAKDPPIRAVWITAGNPVAMLPDSNVTQEALRSREFVVVVDSFMTDTARCAHLVLPTNTLLEADDLVGAYGHHWIGVARPVVPPPVGVRSDLEIVQGLAERVGLADVVAGDARAWQQRMVATKLVPAGVTLDAIERGPLRNPFAPKVLFADRQFSTPSGRVQLVHDAPAPEAAGDSRFPMTLMALSTDKAQSSQWSKPLAGPLPVTVHPEAVPGIADGAVATLESALGTLTVRVRHDSEQRRDVALAPKGGHLSAGHCTNAITRAAVTDMGEGGALYDQRVRIVPIVPIV